MPSSEAPQLGQALAQSSVAKYMVRRRKPPSPNWRTFLNNHMADLVAIDFFVVPTATFRLLYCFVVLSLDRRRVVHFNVTASTTRGAPAVPALSVEISRPRAKKRAKKRGQVQFMGLLRG